MNQPRPRVRAVCPCGNPAPTGTLICNPCVKATSRRLGDMQAHHDELEITLTRQAKLEAAPEAGRSANKPLPYHTTASDLLAEQRAILASWAQICVDDLHTAAPKSTSVRGLSLHVEANLTHLRKHEAAPDLVVEIRDLCQRILDCVDRQDRSYPIGPCPCETDTGWCDGTVIGFIPLSDPDSKRPAKIACDLCGTEWPGEQWSSLARLIQRRKQAA